jgi:hypothetical protein
VKAFKLKENNLKFLYEVLGENNFYDDLQKTEPFEHEQFYSSLSKSNISEKDYTGYLTESAKFPSRLDYFLHYNERDVEVMPLIIDRLCDMYAKYHVDMLQCVSLSGCASRLRYTVPYESFDINGNYAKNTTTKYTLTEKEFKHDCLSYKQQDVAKKRNKTHNITETDYAAVKEMFEKDVCHMCGEGFDLSNRPTLDRIDKQ